jgi:dTMP kinase
MKNNKKGLFITIYGVNNLGKTTHCEILEKKLLEMGFKVKRIKYPVYSVEPSGSYINRVLREKGFRENISGEEFQLWYVLNRYQYQDELKKLIEDGYIVIAEDYSGTGIAWGIAKGVDPEWIIKANENLLKEDLAVLFTGERKLSSIEEVHKHEQNSELIERCRQVHLDLSDRFNWKKMKVEDEIEDTAKNLFEIVFNYLTENNYVS